MEEEMSTEYDQLVAWRSTLSTMRSEMSKVARVSLQDQIDALGEVMSTLDDVLDEMEP
jgi:hypothetical protein